MTSPSISEATVRSRAVRAAQQAVADYYTECSRGNRVPLTWDTASTAVDAALPVLSALRAGGSYAVATPRPPRRSHRRVALLTALAAAALTGSWLTFDAARHTPTAWWILVALHDLVWITALVIVVRGVRAATYANGYLAATRANPAANANGERQAEGLKLGDRRRLTESTRERLARLDRIANERGQRGPLGPGTSGPGGTP